MAPPLIDEHWEHVLARWATPPQGCARLLDLRTDGSDPLPPDFTPDGDSYVANFPASAQGPRMVFHYVGSGRQDHYPIVVVLDGAVSDGGAPVDPVAVLVEGSSVNDACAKLSEWDLDLRRLNDTELSDKISAVQTALADPNSWHPGLADADLRADQGAHTAIKHLLALAHPRIRTAAAAVPLAQVALTLEADEIAEWLSSPLTVDDIAVLATWFSAAQDALPWMAEFPDSVTAADWFRNGPNATPDRLVRLHARGWTPADAVSAVLLLAGPDSPHRLEKIIDVAVSFAELPVNAQQAITAIAAGLRLTELQDLLQAADSGASQVNWDALAAMGALRR